MQFMVLSRLFLTSSIRRKYKKRFKKPKKRKKLRGKRLIETNPSFFSQFTLVVATQLVENSMIKLDRICREVNVILIFARSYGLTGFVRISLKIYNRYSMIVLLKWNLIHQIFGSWLQP